MPFRFQVLAALLEGWANPDVPPEELIAVGAVLMGTGVSQAGALG